MMNRLRSGCGGNPELISTAKVGILCVVSMATVLAFTTPTAADVRFVAYDHGVKSAYIEGTIQKTDVDIFSKGVEDSRSTVVNVLLDSHGGDVYAAMAIGRVLRENELSVAVAVPAECLSSCALIYIAGVQRVNFGTIGLHRPYLIGSPLQTAEISKAMPKMLQDIRSYVSEMGVTEEFFNIMVNTDPANVRLYRADIEDLVPEKDPVWEEIDVARQARQYGISTEEYRTREKYGEKTCKTDSDYTNCTWAIDWGLSLPLFRSRLGLAWQKCRYSDATALALQRLPKRERADSPLAIQRESCIRTFMLGK